MRKHLGKFWLLIPVALLLGIIPLFSQSPATGFVKLAAVSTSATCPTGFAAGSFCYVDTTCPNGVTCYYQVFALDANGVSSSAAVPTTLPVTSFQGTQDYVTAVIPSTGTNVTNLGWLPSTGDVSYVIYRYTPPLAPTGLQAVEN
jgi:hypothetical protein